MRTTLQIDEDVLSQAREIARRDGRGIGAVISDLARQALRPVGIRDDGGLPVFDVPADAPPITADDVARAFDED